MSKQTAVQWLVEQMNKSIENFIPLNKQDTIRDIVQQTLQETFGEKFGGQDE